MEQVSQNTFNCHINQTFTEGKTIELFYILYNFLVMMIDVVMNGLFIKSRSSRCCFAWGLIILKSPQIADVYLLW